MTVRCEPYQAKSVMFRNSEPDFFYRGLYTLNPYMGCSMGCRYCYVQDKKHNVSSGLEDEKDSVVQMKINAPFLLGQRLAAEPDRGLIVLGESCEPYDKPEEKYLITRNLLEILSNYDYPLHIITRSPLVVRDIDILRKIHKKSRVLVTISIPLISKDMVAKFESGAPLVKDRLKTLTHLRKAGITSGVALSPLIPYISDGGEVVRVLKKAASNNALYAVFNALLIKSYQREMFFTWLDEKYPHLLEPYYRLYGESENPSDEYIDKFAQQFRRIASDFGLRSSVPADYITSEYRQELLSFGSD